MIQYIFGLFLIIGILFSLFTGNIGEINTCLLETGQVALEMVFHLFPLLCLWLGVMKIAEDSGLLQKMARGLSRLIGPIFPELDKDDISLSYIASNIMMNILGLGNAATPFGLKAMEELNRHNLIKGTATRSMITLLVINTASVTLIPTTVISMRTYYGSTSPTEIVVPCIIATFLSCAFGLILDRIFAHLWK